MDFIGNIIDWVIEELLKTGCDTSYVKFDNVTNLETIVNTMWGYIETFAIGLTIIFFLIEINRHWVFEGNDITMKSIAAPLIKLVAAVGIISFSGDIFGGILGMNDTFVNWADGAFTAALSADLNSGLNGTSVGEIVNNKVGFLEKVILVLPVLLAYLITIACNLVFIYKGFLYKIEFIARLMFAPIAMADVYSWQNSNAIRYIKGTIALVLYAGCLVILPKITMSIAIVDFQNTAQEMIQGDVDVLVIILKILELCVAPIAAIGVTGAAKTLTKEAVGA